MAQYLVWRFAGACLQALPQRLAYRLGRFLARLVWWGWPSGRRRIRANLRRLLPDVGPARIDQLGRRQLQHYAELLVDAARSPARTRQDAFDALITDEWPRLDAALAGGEPLIFACMHFGNWDAAGAALAARMRRVAPGRRLHVLVEPVGPPRLDGAIQAERARLGMVPLPMETGAMAALRALRRGDVLGILIDRPLPPHQPGVEIDFLGGRCRVPAGMARLALASGARVIPLALARAPGERFRFRPLTRFGFDFAPSGDRAADVHALTQAVFDAHAPWIRAHPDQWYQFRSFFLPPAEPQPRSLTSPPRDEAATEPAS